MAEEEKNLQAEEEPTEKDDILSKDAKSLWQMTKESWYDKVDLSVKQLDIIIAVCLILLALTVVAMYVDTAGILRIMPN